MFVTSMLEGLCVISLDILYAGIHVCSVMCRSSDSVQNTKCVQWNPQMRTLLGPESSVLIREVSSSQGF